MAYEDGAGTAPTLRLDPRVSSEPPDATGLPGDGEIRPRARHADVLILGAGLGGAAAAFSLANDGHKVTVVDLHRTYPIDFRCERLSPLHLAIAERVGLAPLLNRICVSNDDVTICRQARTVGVRRLPELGISYEVLVNKIRAAWPASVDFVEGQPTVIETGRSAQKIVMRNGQEFTGRVLVMATGPSERARRLLGVRSDRVENHTLTVGFSIVPARGRAFPFQSLTYYGAHGDRLGYVNFFPMNGAMRINLFCYPTDPQRWIREFRDAPMQALFRMAPDLESHIRGASAVDEAQMRVSHIVQATDYRRDGFVLLGEAFRSTCPATGTGALCVLNDVERLCKVHLPKWLSSDEMSAASLASFYDDPVKVACDARSRLLARRLRGMAVGGGIIWGMRHTVSDLRSRLGCARDGLRRRWSEKFYGKGRLENA